MRRLFILTIFWITIAGVAPSGAAVAVVRTLSGEEISGELLWNGGNLGPIDRIQSYRSVDDDARQPLRWSLFGVRVLGPERPAPRSMTLPWGIVAQIEPTPDRVRLLTRGGLELLARGGDLAPESRLTLVGGDGARRELSLEEVASVQFAAESWGESSTRRLYGEVEWAGGAMSGWIEWDRDERLWEELLDGDTDSGRRQSIAFREIQKVEPVGLQASDVTLRDGSVRRLFVTNDVAQGHRGVIVESERLRVELPWRVVRSVEFLPSPRTGDRYGGGGLERPLRALICARDGRRLHGVIEWDLDERYQFETLEGSVARSIEYRIRFDAISEVASINGRGSLVRLQDGQELQLFNRVDVASDHRGIRLDGEQTLSWYEAGRVLFANSAEELRQLVESAACGDR